MSKRKSLRSSRGSAFVWTIIWLAGMAAVAWATLNFAVPKFEHKLQATISNAVASINESPVIVAVKGQHITLSGQLDSEENRQAVIDAAQSTWGILSVNDELSSTDAGILTSMAQSAIDTSPTPSAANSGSNDTATQSGEASSSVKTVATANTENTEVEVLSSTAATDQPAAENSEQATVASEEASLDMPSIDISIAGEILVLEGVLAPADDPSELIQTALTSFNLDIVSNGIDEGANVSMSQWMTSITQLLPAMSKLSNPHINVVEKQITISGVAPTSQIHDAVIGVALSSLGDYSLVERISINASAATVVKASEEEQLAAEAKAAEEEQLAAEAKAAEEEQLAAEAKAAEEAQLAAEAKAAEEERLAAEAKAAEEEERLAAEAKAAEEEERLAAEAKAAEEEERLAAEAKAAEEERIAAEAKAVEEEERLAAEAKAAEEEERLAAEAKAAEEEERLAAEAKAAEEEERLAAETKAAEEEKLAAEAKAAALKLAEASKPTQNSQVNNDKLHDALSALPSVRILFESNSNVFTAKSIDTLDMIAEVLLQFSDTKVSIEGHTDATGTRDANLELSLLRATTVRDYLIEKGVSVYNLRALGFGEGVPIADNRTIEGRATNRRIDFTF